MGRAPQSDRAVVCQPILLLWSVPSRSVDGFGRWPEAGIEEVEADVLPQDKAAVVEKLHREGRKVPRTGNGERRSGARLLYNLKHDDSTQSNGDRNRSS